MTNKEKCKWFGHEHKERRESRQSNNGMGGNLLGTAIGLAIMLPAIKSFTATNT